MMVNLWRMGRMGYLLSGGYAYFRLYRRQEPMAVAAKGPGSAKL